MNFWFDDSALSSLWGIGLMAVMALTVALGGLVAGHWFRPRRADPVKDATYECGNLPSPVHQGPVPIRFFMIAVCFLLLAVETVLLWPWAAAARRSGAMILFETLSVLVIVGVGFGHAWSRGAFTWRKP